MTNLFSYVFTVFPLDEENSLSFPRKDEALKWHQLAKGVYQQTAGRQWVNSSSKAALYLISQLTCTIWKT